MPQAHLEPQRDDILRRVLAHVDAGDPLLVLKAPPGSGKTYVTLRAVERAWSARQRVAVAGAGTRAKSYRKRMQKPSGSALMRYSTRRTEEIGFRSRGGTA